jgi:hypothetical protein
MIGSRWDCRTRMQTRIMDRQPSQPKTDLPARVKAADKDLISRGDGRCGGGALGTREVPPDATATVANTITAR